MSEDQFDIKPPQLKFSDEKIEIEALEHSKVRGGFVVESTNGTPIRGVCYSTHPYLSVLRPQFEGVSVRLEFCVIHGGFCAGDTLSGEFCVVVNGSEELLPFEIRYIRRFPESSIGRIDSDEQFNRLCREHWNEAMQLFYSKEMYSYIDSLNPNRRLLYLGFSKGGFLPANLEAYLVAVGAKEPVIFSVDESDRNYYGLKENHREAIEITRSTWGYIDISISCDADFITLEKDRITGDFFMGSKMTLSMYLHPGKLHAGKNYARIVLSSRHSHQEIRVMATSQKEDFDIIPASYTRGMRLVRLTKLYEDYRFEKISSKEWSDGTVEILDALLEDEPQNALFMLMKAHALIVGGDKKNALWIIQELRSSIEDRHGVNWAYLLYLCTLIEKDESYIDRLAFEIEAILLEKPQESIIFWFLLFLRREYIDDYKRRLNDIRQWMPAGLNSPFFYIEAEYLLRQEPYLFTRFDEFNMRLLRWMLAKGRMTEALSDQVCSLIEGERIFDEDVYSSACACYDLYPREDFLNNIVMYLLRCHKYGREYLKWYEKAVSKELNFTGLYEAYVLSLPINYSKQLPQMVVMYFRYQNTLPAERKAFVYANVIRHQNSQLRIYGQYIHHIEEFALEMVRKGRIDENLAIIYRHIFLEKGILDQDVADAMGDILFYDKIYGLDSDIVRVIVYQEALEEPVICQVRQNAAYAPVYSMNYRIFLEDRGGELRSDPSEYYTEHLMQPGSVYRKLYRRSGRRLHYFLYDLNQRKENEEFSKNDVSDLVEFMNSGEVSERYKRKLYPSVMRFLSKNGPNEKLQRPLIDVESYEGVDSEIMSYVIDLCVKEEEYDRAYELLGSHNGIEVPGKSLLKHCSHRVSEDEDRADDFLIALCRMLMRQYLSSEETITYLNRYLIGPTDDMVMLWRFASARNLETRALEERILSQMLFTENIDEGSGEIYDSYLSHHPNRMVAGAYANFFARRYLLTGEKAPGRIFDNALQSVLQEEDISESLRAGLCMSLISSPSNTKEELDGIDRLLTYFVQSGTYFSFFKNLDRRRIVKYHFYDKTFVEYRGEPGQSLVIRFRQNEMDEETAEMIEMYPGIYVRLFVLFFGDVLSYKIVYADDMQEVLEESNLNFTGAVDEAEEGRYEKLNSMQSAFLYSNEKKLLKDMKHYEEMDFLTDKLFSML